MTHHLGVFLPLCRDIFDSYQVKHIKLGLFISSLPQTLSFGGRYCYNQSLQMSNVSLINGLLLGRSTIIHLVISLLLNNDFLAIFYFC